MNKLIITILFLTSFTYAQDYQDGVYFWKNSNKQVFNYFAKPNIKVELEKLNAGSDEFYAMLVISTNPGRTTREKLESLSMGYEIKRVPLKANVHSVVVNFEGTKTSIEAQVLNTPNGPQVDDTIFITKEQYQEANKAKRISVNITLIATPLVTYIAETKTLPNYTCKELGKEGLKLKNVAYQYSALMEEIDRETFKYSETKEKLLKELESKCFGNKNYKANSFHQLMNSQVKLDTSDTKIEAQVFRDSYKNVEVNLELKQEVAL